MKGSIVFLATEELKSAEKPARRKVRNFTLAW
jgi:hypothetical protein